MTPSQSDEIHFCMTVTSKCIHSLTYVYDSEHPHKLFRLADCENQEGYGLPRHPPHAEAIQSRLVRLSVKLTKTRL